MELENLYQELIIDHGMSPRNCHKLNAANCSAEGFNPLCGDRLTLYLKIENNYIKEVSFEGTGCAISTASASLMTEILQGKTIEQALELFSSFQNFMTTENPDTANETPMTSPLGKLSVFTGVKAFPTRIKCATLAWHTLRSALLKEKTINTTE